MKPSLHVSFLRGWLLCGAFALASLTAPPLSAQDALSLPLSSGNRVALIIGNNDYPDDGNFPDLLNCANDAGLIRNTLEALQFKVFFLENASRSEMDDKLTQFENAIEKGGTAVFYFAGHGIEFEGKNYLMGSNARLEARSRLGEEAMDAETFAAAMMQAGAKSSFLFLDCCREVPKDANWLTRSAKKRGLAELHVDGDIIIAYAAKPGQAALDGSDGNSPYARALSKWLPSGLKHGDMFEKVRLEVHESTSGAQRTWETGSFLSPFFFNASGNEVAVVTPPAPLAPVMKQAPAANVVGSRSSDVALKEFQQEMRQVLVSHPAVEDNLVSQRRRLDSLVGSMEKVPTDGLPKDLQEAYADYIIPFKTQAGILNDVPVDFPWGQSDAILPWMQRMNQTNPDLVARISSVPTLEENIKQAGTKLDGLMAKYGIFIPSGDVNDLAAVGNQQAASPAMTQEQALQAFKHKVEQLVKNNPTPAVGAGNSAQMHYLLRLAEQVAVIDTTGLPPDLKLAYDNFATPLRTIHQVLSELPADLPWDDDQAMFNYGQQLGMQNPALAQRLISIGTLAAQFEAAGTKVDELMAKYGIFVPQQ